MRSRIGAVVLALAFAGRAVAAEPAARPAAFQLVAVGTSGGLHEDDLTAFLLAPAGSRDFVALDAGTLLGGLRRLVQLGRLPDAPSAGAFLRERIRAYLVSHPHLDHVAGLALSATDDTPKPVLGLPETLDVLRDHLFNWKLWPNFTDEGAPPRLGVRQLVRLRPGVERPIEGTTLAVEAWPLDHAGARSTAFLVRSGGAYALYLGDTGPDPVERGTRLEALFSRVAPLLRTGALRVVLAECSYPDGRPDSKLFGHLTPRWLVASLERLARRAFPARPTLAGLLVVVTHVKPALEGPDPRDAIRKALAGKLDARFVVPSPGDRFTP